MTADAQEGNQSVGTAVEVVGSEMIEDSEMGNLWAEAVAEKLGKVAPVDLPALGAPYIAAAVEQRQSPSAVEQAHKAAAVALVVYC